MRPIRLIAGMILLATLAVAVTPLRAARRVSFAVLVNPKAVQNLSRADLVRVLKGDMRFWSNHQAIRIILPPRASESDFERVLRPLVSLDVASFQRMWEMRRAHGETTTIPIVAPDEQMAIRAVVTDSSFLAIIDADKVSAIPPAMKTSIQVLTVDNRMPDADGYALAAQVD